MIRPRPRAPGRPSPARSTARAELSVCTESITHTSGRSAAIASSTVSRSVSARIGTVSAAWPDPSQPLGAQADLRGRLLAADVQRPVAGGLRGCRAPCSSASTCRSPASRRAAPASRARGRRRARGRARRCRCDRRCTGAAPTSRSATGGEASGAARGRWRPRHRPGRACPPSCHGRSRRAGRRSSTSVFQASQTRALAVPLSRLHAALAAD